jgi:hypothetical protein
MSGTYLASWSDLRYRTGFMGVLRVMGASVRPWRHGQLSDDGLVSYLFLDVEGIVDANIIVFFDVTTPGAFREMFSDLFGMKLPSEVERVMTAHSMIFNEPKYVVVKEEHPDLLSIRRADPVDLIERLVDDDEPRREDAAETPTRREVQTAASSQPRTRCGAILGHVRRFFRTAR